MNFLFSGEDEAFRQEVRAFIDAELSPAIMAGEDPYEDELFEDAMAFRRKLGAKKWIGIGWPEEYGGLGASITAQMVFREEMIYHHAPLDPQAYQLIPALMAHGSDYLKKRFIQATANQEIFWCVGFSEPDAGSDLASLRTTATRDGDSFVINGQKLWTTNAHRADWIHILTRTDPHVAKHRGITYFVLDMRTPGITVEKVPTMVENHRTNQVFFDNVRVPLENVIGEVNQGWYVATTTLDSERSGIREVAGASRALADIAAAVRSTSPGWTRGWDPIVRNKMADLAVQLQVGRMLAYRVGWMQQEGKPPTAESSVTKLFNTELHHRITQMGMEVLGLYAQVMPGSRWVLGAGAVPHDYLRNIPQTLAAGSSEIQRNIIAGRGLGLPRG